MSATFESNLNNFLETIVELYLIRNQKLAGHPENIEWFNVNLNKFWVVDNI